VSPCTSTVRRVTSEHSASDLHDSEFHDPELHDPELHDRALNLLRRLTCRADAEFHPGQWEAVRALAADRSRVLVVQRTGWGKSAVYFLATRLLRDAGAGPTILISPLLALMRNQIEAAERMGVVARTINSSNQGEWSEAVAQLQNNEVDLLLISPERLANARFREQVLDAVGPSAGLVVVDEAHCISDWGHDFRPDYRRVRSILNLLPVGVPVLACTATANDRVVSDIVDQLGNRLVVERGSLARSGLALAVVDLPSSTHRLAWLAQVIPTLEGTGIVYCLTKRDAENVAGWLAANGIEAACYTGDSDGRPELERRLLANELKVLVATSALGMGFDKPDLAFVIHYQAPGNVVAYYQQVGRAGRQLDRSVGVLLRGSEDADIQDWFISRAFPTREEAEAVVTVLEGRDGFTSIAQIEREVNVRPSRIELLMKNLEVDGAVVADGRRYQRTPRPWVYDDARVQGITTLRREEQAQMLEYGTDAAECRMAFLGRALDDPNPAPCGVCDLCAGTVLPRVADPALSRRAVTYLRNRPIVIEPRKQWPDRTKIPEDRRLSVGRALGGWSDGAWGDLVRTGQHLGQFDDELVSALADLVALEWSPDPCPCWVTFVPSPARSNAATQPDVLGEFAERLSRRLGLPLVAAVHRCRETSAQRMMENSARQFANVHGAFEVGGELPAGPALLIDDVVGSRWTITEVGALLRDAGCPSVYPLALAVMGNS
jgi:ATP-dependent DNA helicase RecQ